MKLSLLIGLLLCMIAWTSAIKDTPKSELQAQKPAESAEPAVLGGFNGESMFLTSWWALWHQHYSEMQKVREVIGAMASANMQTSSSSSPSSPSSPSSESNESAESAPGSPRTPTFTTLLDASADDAKITQDIQEKIQQLEKLQDMMQDRLRQYWEFLSNSSLSHQAYPRAKNAEIHSEGIINDAVTADVEWDHADDEDKLVSKYWMRFSSDCTDLGKLDANFPPLLVLQVDPLIDRYQVLLGPVHVPETARCLMIYAADKNSQPFPDPVPLLLPQFKFPKPNVLYATHCQTGWNGCFDVTSNGTSCESLMGKKCCGLPMCVGCKECSQLRNVERAQLRPRLYGLQPVCTDRWERQGFAAQYHFTCAQALSWGLMSCDDDVRIGFCQKTCRLCDRKEYFKKEVKESGLPGDESPAFPSKSGRP